MGGKKLQRNTLREMKQDKKTTVPSFAGYRTGPKAQDEKVQEEPWVLTANIKS